MHSFDYDTELGGLYSRLRRRLFPDDPELGSRAGIGPDAQYLSRLGSFDVVYSWGVLHHTGDMWHALAHAFDCDAVRAVSYWLYNDAGGRSRRLAGRETKVYSRLPTPLRPAFALVTSAPSELRLMLSALVKLRPSGTSTPGRTTGSEAWHESVARRHRLGRRISLPVRARRIGYLTSIGLVVSDCAACDVRPVRSGVTSSFSKEASGPAHRDRFISGCTGVGIVSGVA